MGQSSSGVRSLGPPRRCRCCSARIHQAARLPRRAAGFFGRGQLLPGRGLTAAVLWGGSAALPAACAWRCCHLTSLVLEQDLAGWLLGDGNGFRICAAPVSASSLLRDCQWAHRAQGSCVGWGCVAGRCAGHGRGAAAAGQCCLSAQSLQVSSVGSSGLDVPLCAAEPGAGLGG